MRLDAACPWLDSRKHVVIDPKFVEATLTHDVVD